MSHKQRFISYLPRINFISQIFEDEYSKISDFNTFTHNSDLNTQKGLKMQKPNKIKRNFQENVVDRELYFSLFNGTPLVTFIHDNFRYECCRR